MTCGSVPRRLAICLALLGLLVAPALAQGPVLPIKGALTYKGKQALPPDSTAIIDIRDTAAPQAAPVAETRIPLQGHQVPIPFTLSVERSRLVAGHSYSLKGSIVSGGRTIWISTAAGINPASASFDVGTLALHQGPGAAPSTAASSYRCGDLQVGLAPAAGGIVLTVDRNTYEMVPVEVTSGSKWAVPGDPTTFFWEKTHGAALSLRGRYTPPCGKIDHKASMLRVWGVEPAWSMEIGDHIKFSADGTATKIEAPTPMMVPEGSTRRYSVQQGGHTLDVRVVERVCKVAATTLPQPSDVTASYDGRQFHGCGGDQASLLMGRDWQVTTIAGARAAALISMKFESEGRLSGSTGCNTYVGRYTIDTNGLTISGLSTTLKGCAEPLAAQEKALLAALQDVRLYDIGADGSLVMKGKTSHNIAARR